jgi:hypothetical protein
MDGRHGDRLSSEERLCMVRPARGPSLRGATVKPASSGCTTLILRRQAKLPHNPAEATTLAINALAFIAADDDLLGRFLATTGLGPAELRAGAENAAVLAGVMDFLLADEASLLRFCSESGVPPEAPARARMFLPGTMPRD